MRIPVFVAAALVLSAAIHPPLHAQSRVGSITGRVVDETGGVLPGATVARVGPDTTAPETTVTDSLGRFTWSSLAPDRYTVSVSLPGCLTVTREDVIVTVGEPTMLVLVMRGSGTTETVTVRGTAQNYASSVAGKRAADGIVDMFNTDEIGRLPDKNIGETLNRIPGVSMLFEKGEGRFIQIRGISPRLNNVTINGLALGNAETESGGRLAPLDVVGGELLAGVQVLKSSTPDMDGQGIGGTLNLTTKQPFEFANGITALFSARTGVETISPIAPADTKETPYTMDGTVAGQARGRRLGWLLGASFSNRATPLLGIYYDNWRPVSCCARTRTIHRRRWHRRLKSSTRRRCGTSRPTVWGCSTKAP